MVKAAAEMERPENCPECDKIAARDFVPQRLYLNRTSVQHAEYNPGLGKVVRNRQHREDLCKEMGVIEIGNDFKSGEAGVAEFDKKREEKLAKAWEDV